MKGKVVFNSEKLGRGWAVIDLNNMKVEKVRIVEPVKVFQKVRRII